MRGTGGCLVDVRQVLFERKRYYGYGHEHCGAVSRHACTADDAGHGHVGPEDGNGLADGWCAGTAGGYRGQSGPEYRGKSGYPGLMTRPGAGSFPGTGSVSASIEFRLMLYFCKIQ